MAEQTKRLSHIDWMRGLACVLMFQTHCYDSWLSPEARKAGFFHWSQLAGTFPAPLFTFLAGVSFALVTDRLRAKGGSRNEVAWTTIRRGVEIFGLGMLFRVQEFALGYPWAPWTDLLRVDILNILGLSMILMGALCWVAGDAATDAAAVARARRRTILAAFAAATVVALLTPPLWTTHRPRFLPWYLESYINGVHVFDKPQPWLFPLFPWSAFAFAGLGVGSILFSDYVRKKEGVLMGALAGAGALACAASVWFDSLPLRIYAEYDYWHTSPNFFLIRCGILLMILAGAYTWCRWGLAQKGFSPIIQLGTTSLLVYWVHIEFVYGRFSILPKRQCSILRASAGLLTIFLAMVALSLIRTKWKGGELRAWLGRWTAARPAGASPTAGS